jgi:glycosyltransferase involved in cell wall biosynthesis
MRILHISNNYTPYSGGLVSSLNAIVPALHAAGHEVTLIVPEFTTEVLHDPSFVQRIPSVFRFLYRNNPCSVLWRPRESIEETVKSFKPDLIHVHHPFLLGFTGSCLAKKYAIPCIFTYHTMYDQYAHYLPLPPALTAPYITQMVLNFCNTQVNAVIAPSGGIKDWLLDRDVTTPVHVIPSPVQDHFFQSREQRAQHERLKLLYVGRLTPEKNVGALIAMFARMDRSRFHLTIVGFGSQEAALRNQAYEQHGLSEHAVCFIIKPSLENLLKAYREADLFLFPSVTDTQGLVLGEALAAGLPIIAFDGCGQRDSVIEGVNGFLVGGAEVMRERIEYLHDNPDQLRSLSTHAQQAAQLFSKKTIIQTFVDLYDQYRRHD